MLLFPPSPPTSSAALDRRALHVIKQKPTSLKEVSWLHDLIPLREREALFFLKYRMQILFWLCSFFAGDGKVMPWLWHKYVSKPNYSSSCVLSTESLCWWIAFIFICLVLVSVAHLCLLLTSSSLLLLVLSFSLETNGKSWLSWTPTVLQSACPHELVAPLYPLFSSHESIHCRVYVI